MSTSKYRAAMKGWRGRRQRERQKRDEIVSALVFARAEILDRGINPDKDVIAKIDQALWRFGIHHPEKEPLPDV